MQAWLAPKYLMWLWQGFGVTVGLALTVALAATAFGFVLAIARHARYRWLRRATATYVLAFRNTPLLVQLFFWYFGAATLMPDALMQWLNTPHGLHIGAYALRWPSFEFVAGWIGLTCYTAAFITEEFQAGLRGVPAGQHAAAAALGLTPLQAFRYVVLPQAVRISLPPLFGQYMNLVKNSSLTMAIGLAELSYASRQVETETFKTFEAFGVATVLYIVAVAVIEAVSHTVAHTRERDRTFARR
ncbi:MAG: polar amino acid transport system permease protein [Paraburkholderia sp.]|jgi:polar amino acid transport system permease protein|uniref:amino acid ABC transporter permease n=1 Tax=Paraburkholderia sp. TaxID=1926495 RepID=UPI002B00228D|nr:amino acid ABC transporter permease [Paraburkholderia sp.]MEA3085481.1 polar amino acid transport system permease protein [Paraburkholderia sp.]